MKTTRTLRTNLRGLQERLYARRHRMETIPYRMMKILDLPLKAKWYDMIESGEKREEYREIKPYWMKRLLFRDGQPEGNMIDPYLSFKPYTHVRFRYGYTKRTMLFRIDSITIGFGNPEWGAPEDKEMFIIKLGEKQ